MDNSGATVEPRALWSLFEPIHAVTYFSDESREAYVAAGLRGFWRGYFAGRSAPLGPVGPAPVVAAFFNFAPTMVARALPHVWELAGTDRVLQARLDGAVAALRRLTAGVRDGAIAEAAELIEDALSGVDHAGRVLGAANAALPRPADPMARLWWLTTILREHRGDGHVASLVTAGLNGCDVLRWRASVDISRDVLQANRGWSDEEWDAATRRLIDRGWLDAAGQPTATGTESFAAIERSTDRVASEPWRRLGAAATRRLRDVLAPLAIACYDQMPEMTPIGLPRPQVAA